MGRPEWNLVVSLWDFFPVPRYDTRNASMHYPLNELYYSFLCFVDRSSRYNRLKKQLDAQRILSIFHEPVHVSGLSRPIIMKYNRMYTPIGTIPIQPGQKSSNKNKYQLLYTHGCTS